MKNWDLKTTQKKSDFARQRLSQRIEETINVVSMGHHGVYSQSEYLVLSLKEDQRKKFSKDNKWRNTGQNTCDVKHYRVRCSRSTVWHA